MAQIDYLEEERVKLWNKVGELESDIKRKSSDSEKDARQHSKKASEFRNKCEAAMDLSSQYSNQAKANFELIQNLSDQINELKDEISALYSEAYTNNTSISGFLDSISEREEIIDNKITHLEEIFQNSDLYVENLKKLDKYFEDGDIVNAKINALHKTVLSKKTEIDGIHREIFGYSEVIDKDSEDEVYVEGLKDELDQAYTDIEKKVETLNEVIKATKETTEKDYNQLVQDKDLEFAETISRWKEEYNEVLSTINGLLPKALTTGLSYAYSEKKESEVVESEKYSKKFRTATYGLVAVSTIPFIISILSWLSGKELQQLIFDMPRLVLAILPLYVPVMWLAYSANKKLNLSKRLIEEYTHKEVLSKTFEGLSTQVDKISNNGMSMDLNNKLLYNLINVSSENPGKLISDYNKSDHPLTDTLEKSVQLANAVEKLGDIPGMKRITSILGKKSAKLIEDTSKKVNDGLDMISSEDTGDELV